MPSLVPLLLSLAIAVPLFVGLFFLAQRLRNFGLVDVAWAGGFAPVALYAAASGPGYAPRRWLIAAMACAWSLRLALHLGRRVWHDHPREDRRYTQLRRDWAAGLPWKMAGFYAAQAVLLCGLSLPFVLAAADARPGLRPLELAASALWLVAVTGESVADGQLAAFKRAGSKGVCDRGLWRFSRHPNYFFEWLVWVAFALFALPAPGGYAALACPAFMLWLLLRVTGIRYTEDQLHASRGAAYRDYCERTSPFVPWPPRPTSATRPNL